MMIQLEKERIPVKSGQAHTFDFGSKELINMVGMPLEEGMQALREILRGSRIKTVDQRLHVGDVEEVDKQAKYYRKMQKIEQSRAQQRRHRV